MSSDKMIDEENLIVQMKQQKRKSCSKLFMFVVIFLLFFGGFISYIIIDQLCLKNFNTNEISTTSHQPESSTISGSSIMTIKTETETSTKISLLLQKLSDMHTTKTSTTHQPTTTEVPTESSFQSHSNYKMFENPFKQFGASVRMQNSRRAVKNDYPWTIAIFVKIKWDNWAKTYYSCSGSLIQEQWILTAAHCLESESGSFRV